MTTLVGGGNTDIMGMTGAPPPDPAPYKQDWVDLKARLRQEYEMRASHLTQWFESENQALDAQEAEFKRMETDYKTYKDQVKTNQVYYDRIKQQQLEQYSAEFNKAQALEKKRYDEWLKASEKLKQTQAKAAPNPGPGYPPLPAPMYSGYRQPMVSQVIPVMSTQAVGMPVAGLPPSYSSMVMPSPPNFQAAPPGMRSN
mmetsp:Transcript_34347/g.75100  ORF Transcript_34347/g.75100 Transcript_34347/m.75100 type:complete len:199 (-) Transcript_34347:187-783(-)